MESEEYFLILVDSTEFASRLALLAEVENVGSQDTSTTRAQERSLFWYVFRHITA